MGFEMNKKSQTIAIWIILAIVIVIFILLFFSLYSRQTPTSQTQELPEFSPESFIGHCIENYVGEATSIMLPRGGFISPKNYRMFDDTPVEYLCENRGFYLPCVNQHPVLIKEMEKELDNYITGRINECYSSLKEELEKRNDTAKIDFSKHEVTVKFGEDKIFVTVNKDVEIIEKGQKRAFNKLDFDIDNPAYNLALIAMEIAAQEADYCYFEYVGYRILYPRYSIQPFVMSDPTKIYQITDTRSGKTMNVAIRSCAIPPGF